MAFACDALPNHSCTYVSCFRCFRYTWVGSVGLNANNRDLTTRCVWIELKSVVDVVLVSTPFKIVYIVVEFVGVLVVDFGEIKGIGDERCGYESVD